LGSALARNRFPENVRSYLFYGPNGSGKTLMVRACLTETNSMLIDISPSAIEGVYAEKRGED
jgi:AAA+ superfamily predicted ATPase